MADSVGVDWDRSVWRLRGDPLLGPAGGSAEGGSAEGGSAEGGSAEGGSAGGRLRGLRVAVKDLFTVAGHRVGAGNPQWLAEASPQPRDAAAVELLRAAGAQIRGIAQTDDLAYSVSGMNIHYGTPPNPAAPDRVPGGSSSGPAVAVALGEAEIGLGTDTAGSIRVPASCCALFGLRPTHGAVPIDGVLPLSRSFDTVGWLTRDARTLRTVGEVLLPPGGGQTGAARRLVLPEPLFADVELADVVRAAAARAAAAWQVPLDIEPDWPGGVRRAVRAFSAVQAAEAWRERGPWIEAHPGALDADTEYRFRFGATVSAEQEAEARRWLRDWRDDVVARLSAGAWLAIPAAGGPGHPRTAGEETRKSWRRAALRCGALATACGLPCVVLPAARPGQVPIGLAVVGPPGADRALLDAAVRAAPTE